MTFEMWYVLAVLVSAIVLFVTDWVRVDVVALGVILALTLGNILTAPQALAGFANTSVLTIVFLFVVGGAVMQTGLANLVGQRVLAIAGPNETRLIVALMLAVALLSGFMSNTGTVAVLLPAVVALARQARLSPGHLLIPLSFGSMLGGMSTLIGTPPNLLVNEALRRAGYPVFGFFDFLPLGLLLTGAVVLFMATLGRRLLPGTPAQEPQPAGLSAQDLVESYHLAENLRRLRVPAASPLVGQTLAAANLRHDYEVNVLKLMRPAHGPHLAPHPTGKRPRDNPILPSAHTIIEADDWLIVDGRPEAIERAAEALQLEVHPPKPKDVKALVSREIGVAEVIIRQRSPLIGQTLATSHFADTYKLTVLQVRRPPKEKPLPQGMPLRFGDVLLVQGWWQNIVDLKNRERDLIVLGNPAMEMGPPQSRRAGVALVILLGMIALMVAGGLPGLGEIDTAIIALLAAVALILTGCISMDEAYHAVDWKSVVLIAGMLPISTAMSQVGLVDVLTAGLVNGLGAFGRLAVLLGVFVITALLTQVISNTATTVLVAPLALAAAQTLGAQPHAFLMAVAVAASCAFATPVASPTNTMVMGAGNYKFVDYLKVGALTLGLALAVSALALPALFPF